ncbi:MBL fold metallo-hydrolase [Candidatus Woesearchaeota archaeon]|nr:MBL fold metallo-hydrolase [Candidatus Woesearchaeota archaeon]
MKLTFRGAAKQVGRSCIDLESKQRRFLLDCGIALEPEGVVYPQGLTALNQIDAVFLSHAHLDHSGALALEQHRGLKAPIFCTAETKQLTEMLLTDSHKIEMHSHHIASFNEADIKRVINRCRVVNYQQEYNYKGIPFTYYDACHIPGSSSIFLELEGKKLLYTGDFNNTETRLVKSKLALPAGVDIMITEATYGDRNHPPRKTTEKRFLDAVQRTLDTGASVLVPAFAVGRAQEIILLLQELKTKVPIYLDGMAIRVTRNFLNFKKFIKDPELLRKAFSKVKIVHGNRERRKVIHQQAIIVTTSGMLTGGPAMEYLKHFSNRRENSILLTGYQAEATNGRMLLESGKVIVDGFEYRMKCNYEQFDFSAHIGLKELQKTIKKVNPQTLILNHGDPPSIENMKQWGVQQGFKTIAPNLLQTIRC